jgi:hypothetical protein
MRTCRSAVLSSATPGAPHVLIASPSYDGKFADIYTESLVSTFALAAYRGIGVSWFCCSCQSILSLARALIAAEFMAGSATHLLMVDADQGWRAEDVLQLLQHDLPLVCGFAVSRHDAKGYCTPVDPIVRRGDLVAVAAIGAAFCLAHRSVFERMFDAYPERRFTDEILIHPTFDIFPIGRDPYGRYTGEDFNFCDLWTAIGGEIWLDTAVQLTHVGTKIFHGDPRTLFPVEPVGNDVVRFRTPRGEIAYIQRPEGTLWK